MIPLATYRLQLRPGFGLDEAAGLAGYLAELGVSHLYASPYLQAAPGSTHGYDVIDHSRVNEELGGSGAHARMHAALSAAGLRQVLDIVPNHMAVGAGNEWWWDVLENGPASLFASHFDVDWDPPESKLRNTVLLPVLGDHYGRVIEAGELGLCREAGTFTIRYNEHRFPVAPRSLGPVLADAADRCGSADLAFVADAQGSLPLPTATDRASVQRRHRDKEVLRRQLERLCEEDPAVDAAVDAELAAVNADADRLDELLDSQNYRLAFWRTAQRELDYRRFFDITSLVGLRVEDPQVFDDTHRLVLGWLRDGVLDGLRIDHPDGLRDPRGYLARLAETAPGAWIVIEKILEPGETLPAAWPVAGTTGYDFCRVVSGVLLDADAEALFTDIYADVTGEPVEYDHVVLAAKHQVMRDVLAADLNLLTNLLVRVCEGQRRWRDYTRHELHETIREVIAAFPVYRTYVRPGEVPAPADAACLVTAIEAAAARRDDLDPELFAFLHRILRGELTGEAERELVARFQQVTGPVMAKGVEDTAFYRYHRFVALNEVGGDPGRFGATTEELHEHATSVQQRRPATMLTTSTHDTKRSEDVRARLAVLSEIPDAWATAVRRWVAANDRHRRGDRPDRGTEYLLYQTLVGAWPIEVDRVVQYMEKATREAKVHTSWIDPDPDYDAALAGFVERVMADDDFAADLAGFVEPLIEAGRINSLTQALIKLTAPGVPDIYQGCELWDLSLVDPDNRRPVDFERRRHLLAELDGLGPDEIWKRDDEGLPKLHVTRAALALRQRRPDTFGGGEAGRYEPCPARGARAAHVVAFARGGAAVTIAPRLPLRLAGDWGDTTVELPRGGSWHNVLTGTEVAAVAGSAVPLAAVLDTLPVALLEREAPRTARSRL